MSDGMKLALYIVFWPLAVIRDYSLAWEKALRGGYVYESLEAFSAACGILELMAAGLVALFFFAQGISGWWFALPVIGWAVLGLASLSAQIGMIEDYRDAFE